MVCIALGGLPPALARPGAPRAIGFEPNRGQADPAIRFVARGARLDLALTRDGAGLATRGQPCREIVWMRVEGDAGAGTASGLEALPGHSHHLRGRDPGAWTTGVPRYARVRLSNVAAGIDLVWHSTPGGEFEHDFEIAAGAATDGLRLRFEGSRSLSLSPEGDLVIVTPSGIELRQRSPVAWQEREGQLRLVAARWAIVGADRAGFVLGPYDRTRPLTIDPALDYSSYLGGSFDDEPQRVAVGPGGDLYVAGYTDSPDFPVAGPLATFADLTDAFVTRLDGTTGQLIYSTWLGGAGDDAVYGLAVDATGAVIVVGETDSPDFPLVAAEQPVAGGVFDAFIAELSPDGSTLVHSTYLGGSLEDTAFAVALDGSGGALVAGRTASADFPVKDAFLPTFAGGFYDAFLVRLDRAAAAIDFATYLGGSDDDEAFDVAVDASGRAVLTGDTYSSDFPLQLARKSSLTGFGADAFLSRFAISGATLDLSTYHGGNDDDWAAGVAIDGAGNLLLGGTTFSDDFPMRGTPHGPAAGERAFASKLDPAGQMLIYSTVFGGSAGETAIAFSASASGAATIVGVTASDDLPIEFGVQPFPGGDVTDGFVAALDPGGELLCSTYFGGSGQDAVIAVAPIDATRFALAGWTDSRDLHTVAPFQGSYQGGIADGMVARIECSVAPGDLGNTLRVTRDPTATQFIVSWGEDPVAASYRLYGETDKAAPFGTVVQLGEFGVPEITLPMGPEPVRFLRVSAGNCCGEGGR